MNAVDEPLDPFDCPRCGGRATERFWGPCSSCRRELTATYAEADRTGPAAGGDAVVTAGGRFEPAMHVVPNHVATKD